MSLNIDIIEQSFEKIKPNADDFVASFYENLFIAYPEVKPLFSTIDMATQEKKLLNSLVLVVEGLRTPESLIPVLQALGKRHIGYGAVAQYYPAVGKVLLTTFEQYLQADWTPEVKQAWVEAYKLITSLMLKESGDNAAANGFREEKAQSQAKSQPKPLDANYWGEKFKQSFQQIKEIYTQVQNSSNLDKWVKLGREIPKKSLDIFWNLPTWLVVAIATIVFIVIYVNADENTLLAEILNGADAISLIVAVVIFIKETPSRRKQFHYQAWSQVDAAHNIKVSYARILALQDLNEDNVSLRGLDVPGAELININLPRANLSAANLQGADLSNANLSHANLDNAKLSQAQLSAANLSHANLGFANLTQANLSSVNLSHANLICANLSNTNMSGANLRNANLSGANLHGAYLTGANLKNARVNISELAGAFLEGAIMPDGTKYKSGESHS
ncbi:MAG TPA: pentapeptide repeat-containing protein [Nostocaceae cyanobacterium]|nr:pentapeptide repeat-containing protein [Nostocaceae cyanobacterium]